MNKFRETIFGKRRRPADADKPLEVYGDVIQVPRFGRRETVPAGDKWDHRFMGIASSEVSSWSKDPSTKVGCVIVSPDRRQIATGYNGFPAGIKDDIRLDNKTRKNQLMVHAELNAILNARVDLTGWTLYVTKPPCINCATAIIQAGIKKVVCPPVEQNSSWAKSQADAWSVLQEAGVKVVGILKEDL